MTFNRFASLFNEQEVRNKNSIFKTAKAEKIDENLFGDIEIGSWFVHSSDIVLCDAEKIPFCRLRLKRGIKDKQVDRVMMTYITA